MFEGLKRASQKLSNVMQRIWTKAPTRDKTDYPELFHTNPRLDPVHVKAQAISTTPWKIYKKAAVRAKGHAADPLDQHPLYDILENPMPMYPEIDGVALLYITAVLWDIVGEVFWLKIRTGNQVSGLLLVPSAWVAMTPTISTPFFEVYPFGVTAGKAFKVDPADIVWFKTPDVTDPYSRGRGRAEPIADEVQADEYAAKQQKNYFFNDAMPPFMIFAPGASPEEAERIKETWVQKLGGFLNARKPAVIPWKDANVQKLSDSPREMDMVESRKFLRDEALQHYQIPPEIFGIVENSNRSTIDSAFYLFAKNVLHYALYNFERVIDTQLVQSDFDKELVFRFDNVVPEDEQTIYTRLSDGLSKGAVTVDEYRSFMKLPKLPNNAGKIFLRQTLVVAIPADEDPTAEPEPTPTTSTEPESTTTENDQEDNEEKTVIRIVEKAVPVRRAHWKAFDQTATNHEPAFRQAIQKFSSNQKARWKSAFNESIKSGASYQLATDKASEATFGQSADKALKSALAPAWLGSMAGGREHAFSILSGMKGIKNHGSTEAVTNDRFNHWIETHGLEKAKGLNDTTNADIKAKLQKLLSDAITDGDYTVNTGYDTRPDIASKILALCDGVYSDMSGTRAAMIARTEAGTSVNYGQHETYKAEGVQKKEWLAVQDDRTRADHSAADGQQVGMNDEFDIGGEKMAYPGDPEGDASEVINCRCTLLPVVE